MRLGAGVVLNSQLALVGSVFVIDRRATGDTCSKPFPLPQSNQLTGELDSGFFWQLAGPLQVFAIKRKGVDNRFGVGGVDLDFKLKHVR